MNNFNPVLRKSGLCYEECDRRRASRAKRTKGGHVQFADSA